MKRFKEFICLLVESSEGDARKYMKKVLENIGLDKEFIEEYGEHWSEQIFNEIRSRFIHNGCDVYFTPGLARIAYGEFNMGFDNEDTAGIRRLCQLVRFITMAHKTDFSRNLEHITVVQEGPNRGQKIKSEPFTFEQLNVMFGKVQQQITDTERNEFANSTQTDNGYTIIELKDFETAHKYQPYTDLPGGDSWCYLENESTFNSYRKTGNRTYLALAPGFEKLKPGDKGYGRSMIGFDMGPIDENGYSNLEICNNRYNHAPDLEHENDKTGDSKYNEIELSKILGFPVWEKCPGYTEEELAALGIKPALKVADCYNAILPILDNFKKAFNAGTSSQIENALIEVFENFDGDFAITCYSNTYLRQIDLPNWRACCITCKRDMDDLDEEGCDLEILYNTKTDKIILTDYYSTSGNTLTVKNFETKQYDFYYADSTTPNLSCVDCEFIGKFISIKTNDDKVVLLNTKTFEFSNKFDAISLNYAASREILQQFNCDISNVAKAIIACIKNNKIVKVFVIIGNTYIDIPINVLTECEMLNKITTLDSKTVFIAQQNKKVKSYSIIDEDGTCILQNIFASLCGNTTINMQLQDVIMYNDENTKYVFNLQTNKRISDILPIDTIFSYIVGNFIVIGANGRYNILRKTKNKYKLKLKTWANYVSNEFVGGVYAVKFTYIIPKDKQTQEYKYVYYCPTTGTFETSEDNVKQAVNLKNEKDKNTTTANGILARFKDFVKNH